MYFAWVPLTVGRYMAKLSLADVAFLDLFLAWLLVDKRCGERFSVRRSAWACASTELAGLEGFVIRLRVPFGISSRWMFQALAAQAAGRRNGFRCRGLFVSCF